MSTGPDIARHPTRRTRRERAGVGTQVGAQSDERIEAGRRDFAARLGADERQTRANVKAAAATYARSDAAQPVVYRRGRQAPPGPADGRTN